MVGNQSCQWEEKREKMKKHIKKKSSFTGKEENDKKKNEKNK